MEDEDEEMSHTWGHVFREAITPLFGGGGGTGTWGTAPPFTMPGPPPEVPAAAPGVPSEMSICPPDGMIWSGNPPPPGYKVVNYCGKAVLRKIKRRRRRRLLTASGAKDLAAIVGTVGKGQIASSIIARGGV